MDNRILCIINPFVAKQRINIYNNGENNLIDVDLLIRTGGELRISNFMIYELAYAELYFTDTYFPDFDELEFDKALDSFNKRDRRFGGVNGNKNN